MEKKNVKKLTSSILWGSAFIIAGIVWLLDSFGVVNVSFANVWPVVFIVIGLNILLEGVFDARG